MKVKQNEYEDFPQVFKGKMGNGKTFVSVIYRNHSEMYELVSTHYGSEDCKYDPYNEIDMDKGAGMHRVHGKKTIRTYDFTR